MREFEFRVWDKKGNQMFRPSQGIGYCNFDVDMSGRITVETLAGGFASVNRNWVSTDDYVIQWYTGVKDKNGKKIFEGDLVRAGNFKPVVVEYDEYYGGFMPLINRMHEEREVLARDIEVVGNIFENPELCK